MASRSDDGDYHSSYQSRTTGSSDLGGGASPGNPDDPRSLLSLDLESLHSLRGLTPEELRVRVEEDSVQILDKVRVHCSSQQVPDRPSMG